MEFHLEAAYFMWVRLFLKFHRDRTEGWQQSQLASAPQPRDLEAMKRVPLMPPELLWALAHGEVNASGSAVAAFVLVQLPGFSYTYPELYEIIQSQPPFAARLRARAAQIRHERPARTGG